MISQSKMIDVAHLTKHYGNRAVVDDVTFSVGRGEIVGFLGPNGAGKTTTMRILACFLPPTGGDVSIAGYDVFEHSQEVRRRVGYLPENVPLYPEMRVLEYLEYRAHLKGLRGRRHRQRVHEVLTVCGVEDVRGSIIGHLSKGYRQRVGLADSLVAEPEVLILDEPSIGLDPNQRRDLRLLIKGLAGRHTVLLSSHLLPEVEAMCERVIIINRGRIVADDTPARIAAAGIGRTRVRAELRGPAIEVLAALRSLPQVSDVQCEREHDGWLTLSLHAAQEADVRGEVFRCAAARQWEVREIRNEASCFEDVFIDMIKSANPS